MPYAHTNTVNTDGSESHDTTARAKVKKGVGLCQLSMIEQCDGKVQVKHVIRIHLNSLQTQDIPT